MTDHAIQGIKLSPQQQHLWLLRGGSSMQRTVCRVNIEGRLAPAVLESAIVEVVDKNEILRTTFRMLPGMATPLQVIHPNSSCSLEWVDLSSLGPGRRQEELDLLFEFEKNRTRELESASPLYAVAAQLDDRRLVLILSVPALVCDHKGLENLVREIEGRCRAALGGGPAAPSCENEETAQYADISETLNECLEGEQFHPGRQFWLETCNAAPIPSPFIGIWTHSEEKKFSPAATVVDIPPSLENEIRQHALQSGSSLSDFLLACWELLIYRRNDCPEELVTGVMFDGRDHAVLLHSPGVLCRYLPLVQKFDENTAVGDVQRAVHNALAEMAGWQHYFSWQQITGGGVRANASPYCAWCFEYREKYPPDSEAPVSFNLERVDFLNDVFETKISFLETTAGLSCRLEYDASKRSQAEAVSLGRQFVSIVKACLNDPGQSARRISLLHPAERDLILSHFSRSEAPIDHHNCVHELFAARAQKSPDSEAVRFEGRAMSYAELDGRANQLARYLRSRGVGPEIRVGLCLERSLEMVVAVLGVLKAGGAYVPLDPEYPTDRLAFMVEDARIPVLLTHKALASGLAGSQQTLHLDRDWEIVSRESREKLDSAAGPEDLAYVIYTSGSTGKPKGAAISHRALVNHMEWMQGEFQHGPKDRILQKTPFSFDASVWEFYAPLLSGGTLVMLPPGGHRDPRYLGEKIIEEQITVVQMVPTLLAAVLETKTLKDRTKLRLVLCGGEELRLELAQQLWSQVDAEVVNLYGPTEATIDSSYWRGRSREQGRSIPIGRPVANMQLYVLDQQMEISPIGVAGELYIGGPGLARGYLDRPPLTAERFLPNPFSKSGGDRLYRTGDLVRWNAGGELDFLGRLDQQVKFRGHRIELGEIEAALLDHEPIAHAAVALREDQPGNKRLVAYLVLRKKNDKLETARLRAGLQKHLPDYMLPGGYVTLEELPLTPNGKLDRKALPDPQEPGGEEHGYMPPQNAEEEILCDIFGEVLRRERVGADENFFEIGGHSLLATQVISRVRSVFGLELPLSALFSGPTVAELAIKVQQAKGTVLSSVPPIVRAVRSGDLPLSYAQQGLWFVHQMEPDSAAYHVPFVLRIRGPLDVKGLRSSLEAVMGRHESLRTRFVTIQGEPSQVIDDHSQVEMPLVSLAFLSGEEREAELRSLAQSEAEKPFVLDQGPLLRAKLLAMGEQEHVLLITMHHIISDGWSIPILLTELIEFYRASVSGERPRLEELPIQYADFAVWQRQWLSGELLDREADYWRQRLQGMAPLELPADHERLAEMSHKAGNIPVVMAAELTAKLKELSSREGATLFMTVMAGFQVLLGWYANQQDVAVGTDIANRSRGETEGLIGFFVNQMVIRTGLGGNPGFAELLQQVRKTALEAYAHQHLPFAKLVELLMPGRTANRSPLVEAKFVLLNTPYQDAPRVGLERLDGLEIGVENLMETDAKFDLLLTLSEVDGELRGNMEYRSELFERATMERLRARLQEIFETVVQHPEIGVDALQDMLEHRDQIAIRKLSSMKLGAMKRKEASPHAISV